MVKGPAMYRQGDVLVVAVDEIPRRAKAVDRDRGRVVLAYGEATGHAHAIADPGAVLLQHQGEPYLHVNAARGVQLTHDEHDTIVVPPGDYRVVGQREYAPEVGGRVATRLVWD
jgi:hypothetical protein